MKASMRAILTAVIVSIVAVFILAYSSPLLSRAQTPVVAIDPGHGRRVKGGGIDPGAVNRELDLKEKDITLDVALRVRDALASCPVQVYLTRESDDPTHTLYDVDELVNAQHPSLGLAIHVNSHKPGSKVSGVEAWYTEKGNDDVGSKRFANLLTQTISERLHIPNRRIKPETQNRHKGLYTHWWNAPSALVELGFIQGDAKLLTTRQSDYAEAIAVATLDMLGISPQCLEGASTPGPSPSPIPPANSSEDSTINRIGAAGIHLKVGSQGVSDALDTFQQLGLNWIREEIPWGEVEPSPGNFRWEYPFASRPRDFHKLFNELHKRHIQPLVILDYGPGYLQSPVNEDELLARWRVYVQHVVDEFGDEVDYWEIENEENSALFWGKVVNPNQPNQKSPPNPQLYARMLQIAHDIIKQKDENDTILLGGLVKTTNTCETSPFEYLYQLHQLGAWDDFDAISYHPYWEGSPEAIVWRGTGFDPNTGQCRQDVARKQKMIEEVRSIHDITKNYGAKPVWITEIGWHDSILTQLAGYRRIVPDEVEADYVVRAAVPLLSEPGVDALFWYTLVDDANDTGYALGQEGRKALTSVSHWLMGSQSLGQFQGQHDRGQAQDDDVYEFRFEKDGRLIIVIWKARGGETPRDVYIRKLPAEVQTLQVFRPTNDDSSVNVKNIKVTNGEAVVRLTEHPLFLVQSELSSKDRLASIFTDWWQTLKNRITGKKNELEKSAKDEGKRKLQETQQELEDQLKEKQSELEKQAEKEVEKQANHFAEKLWEMCFGPAAIYGLAIVFVFRKQRH